MMETKRRREQRSMLPVHPDAAAIDIGATVHVAAVGPARDPQPVRSFGTFTGDLHRLADWFAQCGIKTVVMESTGVYWIPIYEILEQRGFEVWVVNARDAKHVPGRKTDISDAAWLQRLHEFGLLRGSFRPQGAIAALRAYLRQRERLLDYAAAHIQHMQKALTQMNLQIHHVISDITGATGMRIIRAIVAGERDPDTLASYRDIRCHSSVETVRQALIGNYREEHLFALAQALELYEVYQAKVATCDEKIEVVLERLKQPCRAPAKPLRAARHKTRQPNAPAFDARGALYAVLGVDLTQIHGLGPYLALKLISDLRKSCRRAVEACRDDGRSDRDGIGSFLSPPVGADRKGKSSYSDSSKDRGPLLQCCSPWDGLCRSRRVLLRRALSPACPHQSPTTCEGVGIRSPANRDQGSVDGCFLGKPRPTSRRNRREVQFHCDLAGRVVVRGARHDRPARKPR